jgi:hypothetical protein
LLVADGMEVRHRPMRGWLLFLGLVTVGCSSTGPSEARLGEEFELSPNQSVSIAGTPLTIGFRRVVGDSRCPIDAVCITEGSAGVELEVFGSSESSPVVFNTPLPRAWTDGVYQLDVLDLRPQPVVGRVIKPEEYRVRMVVNLVHE